MLEGSITRLRPRYWVVCISEVRVVLGESNFTNSQPSTEALAKFGAQGNNCSTLGHDWEEVIRIGGHMAEGNVGGSCINYGPTSILGFI